MIKLGYPSSTYQVNVIKEDIGEDTRQTTERCGDGDLQSIQFSAKANIQLEFDYLTHSQLYEIRKVMHNRLYPYKLFLAHPSTNQEYTILGGCGYKGEDNDGVLDPPVEFSAADYTNINAYNSTSVTKNATDAGGGVYYKYVYIKFKADISDYINNYGESRIRRITLALKKLYINDGDDFSYKIDYYDTSQAQWVEIKRAGITLDADNVLYASIRPIEDFSTMGNALTAGNVVSFRVRNLYANRDTSSSMSMDIDWAKIYVNGYGVQWKDGNDNFSYRSTYDGAGYTGTMTLEEL